MDYQYIVEHVICKHTAGPLGYQCEVDECKLTAEARFEKLMF